MQISASMNKVWLKTG